jgi:23S rRNA (uridine2552-2'-O)-methyltransferase
MSKNRRSKSSGRWLKEHFSDAYVKRAKQEGHRARSVYKLQEIQQKFKIIATGMTVIDLGAAPGSWSEYAAELVGKSGKVIAADILPMQTIPNVTFLQGDVTDKNVMDQLFALLDGKKADVVISDMAPNMSGIKDVDQARSGYLAEMAFNFALRVLKSDGSLLMKTFQSGDFNNILAFLRSKFGEVKVIKPEASRARSKEVFLLAKKFKN